DARGHWSRISPRARAWLTWGAIALLNCLLFAPGFEFSQPHAHALPLLSARERRNAYQLVLGLVLRRSNLDVFRIALDLMFLLLVVAWASRTRAGAFVRHAAVGVYAFLLLFLSYQHAVGYFYARAPALGE